MNIEIDNRKQKKHPSTNIFDYTQILEFVVEHEENVTLSFPPIREVLINKKSIDEHTYMSMSCNAKCVNHISV